jgi:hypothetical protein
MLWLPAGFVQERQEASTTFEWGVCHLGSLPSADLHASRGVVMRVTEREMGTNDYENEFHVHFHFIIEVPRATAD